MTYTEYKHRHNFSVWAAARAAQRGFTNVEMLRDAIEQCGINTFVNNPSPESEFEAQHRQWCNSICDYLNEKGVQNVSYGRAAKLVNVYLKGMLVLNNLSGEPAKFIHPPIDRILLQNIVKNVAIEKEEKKRLKSTNWTQLQEEDYFRLISTLKTINGNRPFWQLEEHWTVTNE
jgi:hypothetical protein